MAQLDTCTPIQWFYITAWINLYRQYLYIYIIQVCWYSICEHIVRDSLIVLTLGKYFRSILCIELLFHAVVIYRTLNSCFAAQVIDNGYWNRSLCSVIFSNTYSIPTSFQFTQTNSCSIRPINCITAIICYLNSIHIQVQVLYVRLYHIFKYVVTNQGITYNIFIQFLGTLQQSLIILATGVQCSTYSCMASQVVLYGQLHIYLICMY